MALAHPRTHKMTVKTAMENVAASHEMSPIIGMGCVLLQNRKMDVIPHLARRPVRVFVWVPQGRYVADFLIIGGYALALGLYDEVLILFDGPCIVSYIGHTLGR